MSHRRNDEEGQSLVETALILVAFMSLLLAMTAVGENSMSSRNWPSGHTTQRAGER